MPGSCWKTAGLRALSDPSLTKINDAYDDNGPKTSIQRCVKDGQTDRPR